MSEHLKAFLVTWLAWADTGAPDCEPFSRHFGLCSNLSIIWSKPFDGDERAALEHGLDAMFEADDLDMCHPFGFDEYYKARESDTQHLDEARIAWVRSKIARKQEA